LHFIEISVNSIHFQDLQLLLSSNDHSTPLLVCGSQYESKSLWNGQSGLVRHHYFNYTSSFDDIFFADPKSAKKNTVKPSVFFALVGSARVKAARKMLVKLTLGDSTVSVGYQFINF